MRLNVLLMTTFTVPKLSMMQLIAGIVTGIQAGRLGSFAALETNRVMLIGEAVRFKLFATLSCS